ncbi:ubiquitin carboxyl-terminal hydrolase family protein, putative [Ichthyophthirius multifiliis]|uniref:Ubiquitin carboxyl-terminal hydrolase family protein, putative n=1 Tax=Ichthyophthirius multifiliis TaxID=5932 RepID=G0R4X1_ICHMU|nr:ubiquitin carboxyl-terminal hydrolase family protein, putative [Ichthyophthirius multifiliis]EGR27481.1 ubiquitin carboxyl-terminal hydrolase family protein, putative [Ichthyophthirius multifiliis]|eukprot:XP_004024391.1 ubiquitin carboxyl-terminal hydrolase family protein, putative [Ichthyophthirius multifiliis]
MLHQDYQFQISEESKNNKLIDSEIGNNYINEKNKQENIRLDKQQINNKGIMKKRELIKQQSSEICEEISTKYPEKLNEFIAAIKKKTNSGHEMNRLFLLMSVHLFSEKIIQFIRRLQMCFKLLSYAQQWKYKYLKYQKFFTSQELIKLNQFTIENLNRKLKRYKKCLITIWCNKKPLSQNNPLLYEYFKDLVECRESSRRKANTCFKPLNEIDFNTHQRYTHSYVYMPKYYPKNCSNSDYLSKQVLNTKIVTVPMGTEHVSFNIMRKNAYEEQLFKSEDEKYEFDFQISMFKRTIFLLEKVEKNNIKVEDERKIVQQAIDLKIISTLYKHGVKEQQEVCDILLMNPKKTAPLILIRLKEKLQELMNVRQNQAKKQWHEIQEKNYHRSLDHRSFIFKRHDRKLIQIQRFEKESEFRFQILNKIRMKKEDFENKEEFENNVESFLSF